ncbi:MAG: transglutaminase family protein, partial [Verrucomicrobiaceae bacterium]
MRILTISTLWMVYFAVSWAGPKTKVPAKVPATVTEITDSARSSIVTVTQIGRGELREALGTGFIISKDGLIATNLHVIGHARRIQVQLADGKSLDVTSVHATDPALDLAILRVDCNDLKPLPLGDSTELKQGQPVVALGHPQGLQFSVVEGVVSALREVEGTRMIQLAIPIEEGNSGGPLLDMKGCVQGILTLKSAVTENLGYAHPVNDLKLLINKPNPVPMERWLTVGRLDPKAWEPLMGSHWTQHAGVIHVQNAGEGFGGRALCLAKGPELRVPFDVTVSVKLDNESGAAGLAFCSDGGERHYGFYPSNGRLRLTRFDGADVFSWSILADIASPAYRKGDWNSLRVRVDEHKIQCFVNDKLVVERDDAGLRGGSAGLCKFRTTRADFKSYAAGADVRGEAIPGDLTEKLVKELEGFLEKPEERNRTIEKLAAAPVAARSLIEEKTRSLEERVAALRRLEGDVHRQSVTRDIVELLRRPSEQAELLRAALLVSKHDNAELDVEAYLRVAGRMADELRKDPAIKGGTAAAVRRIAKFLFEENGFHGSRGDDIDNLSNSYLNEVLDDREGIPITLSIVFLELARRLGLEDVYGVPLPGRFMVGFDETRDGNKSTMFIDVFDGGKLLKPKEAEALISDRVGLPVDERQLQPATPKAIILRMLYNLSSFAKKPEQAAGYVDLILALDDSSAQE